MLHTSQYVASQVTLSDNQWVFHPVEDCSIANLNQIVKSLIISAQKTSIWGQRGVRVSKHLTDSDNGLELEMPFSDVERFLLFNSWRCKSWEKSKIYFLIIVRK